jgi:hypothetical protein
MHDRLAHARVAQLRRQRALGRIHLQERIAHDLGGHDLKIWRAAQLLRLIERDVLDEIEPAREHLGDLGLPVRNEAQLDLFDLRLRFRAVLEIIGVAHEPDVFAHGVLDDPIGARTDRLLVHALRPDLGIICMRVDHDGAGQIFDRGRKRPPGDDAHAVGVELLGAVDPVDVALGGGLVVRLGDEIQRIDHVVGVELGTVVELHAPAQLELERLLVDPFPGGRELPLVLVGLGIAIDQRVPHLMGQDHADAHVVEIGIGVVENLVVGDAERVVLLGRHRRRYADHQGRERGETTDDGRRTTEDAGSRSSVVHQSWSAFHGW